MVDNNTWKSIWLLSGILYLESIYNNSERLTVRQNMEMQFCIDFTGDSFKLAGAYKSPEIFLLILIWWIYLRRA